MAHPIQKLTPADLRTYQPSLVALLCDVVDNGASVNFIAPLDTALAESFWDKVITNVEAGRVIPFGIMENGAVVGYVQLALAHQPNQPHRAEVQKLLVHTSQRRRGIGRALMQALEQEAITINRRLLVLDTEQDSPAETLYRGLGYIALGAIPEFALNSAGDKFIPSVFFYKHLA